MMGFGSGSGEDPYGEEDDEGDSEASKQSEAEPEKPQQHSTPTPEGAGVGSQSDQPGRATTKTQDQTATEQDSTPTAFSEINVTDQYSTRELAQMLMAQEYREENPRVPYATWRSGTSTGRDRTTIELNTEVDDLVKGAMREFENQYDAEINKADLREFALVWGLMHTKQVFEMAEEWGLQFNG